MTKKKPYVSIIIPVYHDWHRLGMALDALGHQTWCKDRFEILVVNNDPADPFPKTFLEKQNLQLLYEKKSGSYAARNTGIRSAKGDLLGFCDADCIPDRDWIEKAVECFLERPDCFRAAGKIKLIFRNQSRLSPAELHESVFAFRQDAYAKDGLSTTANMFAWRHVFDSVGMFDEILLSGGDLQWGQRAQSAGFDIVYCPEAIVKHPARKSIGELMDKTKRICSGYIRIHDADIRKNPLTAFYHGFCMIKPPVKAGTMIFASKKLKLGQKVTLYFLEYFLKLVQFTEYLKQQSSKPTNVKKLANDS